MDKCFAFHGTHGTNNNCKETDTYLDMLVIIIKRKQKNMQKICIKYNLC